jgi:hypothetical protein
MEEHQRHSVGPDQAAGGLGDDPTGQCIPHGMPRVMTVVYPMEIVITPKTTYILTDYTIPRRVFTADLATGGTTRHDISRFALARFLPDGKPPPRQHPRGGDGISTNN